MKLFVSMQCKVTGDQHLKENALFSDQISAVNLERKYSFWYFTVQLTKILYAYNSLLVWNICWTMLHTKFTPWFMDTAWKYYIRLNMNRYTLMWNKNERLNTTHWIIWNVQMIYVNIYSQISREYLTLFRIQHPAGTEFI